MPQHKSAEKRVRQIEKRRVRNRIHKVRVRTMIKDLGSLASAAEARPKLNEVKAYLDRMVAKGILHRNRASQTKSHLDQMVNALDK